MHPLAIIANLRLQDALDVLFLAVVVYHLYRWFWGTKAFKALVGLLVLGIVYTVARSWGLFLTTWVFQILWQVLVVLLIILFQSEIRQVLEKVNPLQVLGFRALNKRGDLIPNLATAVFYLARRKIGALIIIERDDWVEELITGGVVLEGEVGRDLLISVFQKESPLHDGAMLIRKGRVAKATCYLPLSSAEGLPGEWGTRHRAALGLSERCDAWVLVVSEERGNVSLARGGEMVSVGDIDQLSGLIMEAFRTPGLKPASKWEKIRGFFIHSWPSKLGTLGMVSVFWLLLAGQQNFEVTLRVPLELQNVPSKMEVEEPLDPVVEITVRGLRKDASTLDRKNVHAKLDLSLASFGRRIFPITRDQISMPNERVYVVRIRPSNIAFKIKEGIKAD